MGQYTVTIIEGPLAKKVKQDAQAYLAKIIQRNISEFGADGIKKNTAIQKVQS